MSRLGSKLINSCGFISKCEFLAGMTTNLSEFRRRARTRRCALRGMYADFLGFYRFDRNSGAAQLMSLDPNNERERSIQLSYGCVAVHLADCPAVGNVLKGAGGRGARPRRQWSHVRIVPGAPGKTCAGRAGTVAGYFKHGGRESGGE